MKILIEGCTYSRDVVQNVIPGKSLFLTDEKVTIENVGYFHNSCCDDFVFFLPKVLLEKVDGIEGDRVFAVKGDEKLWKGFSPAEIVDPEKATEDGRCLSDGQKSFLYEFAVWIYRAIAQFKAKNPETSAVWRQREREAGAFRRSTIGLRLSGNCRQRWDGMA